jgi:hypothetical protein
MRELDISQEDRSPVKLALAIGLSVVFVVVVAVQVRGYMRDAEGTASAKTTGTTAGRPTTDPFERSRPGRLVAPSEEPNGQWPESDLAECMKYDPFAMPSGFSSKIEKPVEKAVDGEALEREKEIARKRAEQERQIAKLRDAGVNAILKGSDESTAILGTQMVRVGEEINGFRVRAIESDGIVVERPAVR